MKIVFAGTPEFAAVALKDLLETPHSIVAVYTQPDRPAGRGRKLTSSPVKQLALAHDIPVHQPASLKEPAEQKILADLQPDVMIVVAYGLLLPKVVLEIPRHGCLNIHASLLPRWRGAAPIQRAIEAGDRQTGITIMQMDEGLDTGDILLKKTCAIEKTDTAGSLHDKLAVLGGEALVEALALLENGALTPEKQDDSQATYANKLKKAEALIDWQQGAEQIARKVRAFNPWPVAQTHYGDKILRIWEAEALPNTETAEPGTVVAASKAGIDVATGDGVLRIEKLQLPGGKPLSAQQFLNAQNVRGVRFE